MSEVVSVPVARGRESRRSLWRAVLRVVASEKPAEWAVVASGWTAFVMMLAITADVVGRKFGRPIPGVFEASEEFMTFMLFLPLAYVAIHRGHVFFSLTTGHLPPRLEAFLDGFASTLGALLFGAITWGGAGLAWQMLLKQEYRQGMIDTPIWPFRVVLVLGFGLFTLHLVILAIRDLSKAFARK